MKSIKVLGTGCAKCDLLYDNVNKVADSLGIEYELDKVSDINDIIGFGVMMTPALVIDGIVKVSGKVPKEEEIKDLLQQK